MKKVIFLVAVFAVFTLSSCKKGSASSRVNPENVEIAAERDFEISKGAPVIMWNEEEFDFGTIEQGEKVEHTFILTNTGEGDLLVTGARGSCGCTVPEWPKEAIKAGESAGIKVIFNSTGKKNKTTNTVTLTTNTESGKEVVRIKAFVNPKAAK